MFAPRHIPNAICILRIGLVVPIVWTLVTERYLASLALICFAGFSDGLDGYLAKRYSWQSRLGGLLDPFADKLMLISLFVALAWSGLSPVWLTAVVVLRDLVIVGGATAYERLVGEVEPRPTRVSKLNTGLQITYVLAVIAAEALGQPSAQLVLMLGAGVLVASVVSGLDYVLTWSARARRAA